MSGQPYRTPIDIAKFRNEYLSNLNLEISNVDKNFKANQIYQRTGAPSQPTDTRTTEEKLTDLNRLRIEIRSRLGEIMSGEDANNVVEGLDDNEARFLAQQIDTIIADIKPKYRLGMPAAAFYTYLMKYMEKFNDTQGIEYGLQQRTGEQLIANQELVMEMLPEKNDINSLKRVVELTGEMQGSIVLRQLDSIRKIVEDLPRIYNSVSDLTNAVLKDDILEALAELTQDLPTKTQLDSLKRALEVATESGDRSQMNRILFKLNELTTTTGEVELEVSSLNEDLRKQNIDPIPLPTKAVLREKEIPLAEAELSPREREFGRDVVIIDEIPYSYYNPQIISGLPLDTKKGGQQSLMGYVKAIKFINPMVYDDIFDSKTITQVRKLGASTVREILLNNDRRLEQLWDLYRERFELTQISSQRKESTRPTMGRGFGLNPNKRIIRGRGISKIDYSAGIQSEPEYVPFGKYIVNRRRLADGILMIKRHNGQFIQDFKTKRISPNLTTVFRKVAGGSLPSFTDLEKLDDDEREYLRHVANKSHLSSKLEVPSPKKDKNETLINQFEIMRGQLIAGNDSKELVKKFKQVIVEMLDQDLIPRGHAKDILIELARKDY